MTVENDELNPPLIVCPRCGQDMHPATVKTAIWREDRLFVVEGHSGTSVRLVHGAIL